MEQQFPTAGTPVTSPTAGHRGLMITAFAVLLIGAGVWWFLPRHGGSKPAPVVDGTAVLSVRGPSAPVAVGSQFTVEVFLQAGAYETTAADIVIAYDNAQFHAVGISPGALMPAELAGGAAADGKATITVASGTTPARGDGVIAVLTLVAQTAGEGKIALEKGTQAAAVGKSGNIIGTMMPAIVTVR